MILLVLILIVILIGAFIYWKYFHTYSEGTRSGTLQKFSHQGNIFKTYEGEMILNSVSTGSTIVVTPEKFNFSVIDKELAREIENKLGQQFIVHYKQKNGVLFWRGDSAYIVDRLKTIENSQ